MWQGGQEAGPMIHTPGTLSFATGGHTDTSAVFVCSARITT